MEKSLNSVCRTPREHYAQLLKFTNQPVVKTYCVSNAAPAGQSGPPLLGRLCDLICFSVEEPIGQELQQDGSGELTDPQARNRKRAKQLNRFIEQTQDITSELGNWAGTKHMLASIANFKKNMRDNAERAYLSPDKDFAMATLCELGALEDHSSVIQSHDLSPKCQALVDALLQAYSEDFCGLVFVKRRATVLALRWLIESHPETHGLFRCGTFIGMSTVQSKTTLGHLHDVHSQAITLRMFRSGLLNLIITTDALEEGIDVPACNTVVSFDRPLNLKSYIQRRGRARRGRSKFIVILNNEKDEQELKKFGAKENELLQKCQDEQRNVPEQGLNNDRQKRDSLFFCIDSTG